MQSSLCFVYTNEVVCADVRRVFRTIFRAPFSGYSATAFCVTVSVYIYCSRSANIPHRFPCEHFPRRHSTVSTCRWRVFRTVSVCRSAGIPYGFPCAVRRVFRTVSVCHWRIFRTVSVCRSAGIPHGFRVPFGGNSAGFPCAVRRIFRTVFRVPFGGYTAQLSVCRSADIPHRFRVPFGGYTAISLFGDYFTV